MWPAVESCQRAARAARFFQRVSGRGRQILADFHLHSARRIGRGRESHTDTLLTGACFVDDLVGRIPKQAITDRDGESGCFADGNDALGRNAPSAPLATSATATPKSAAPNRYPVPEATSAAGVSGRVSPSYKKVFMRFSFLRPAAARGCQINRGWLSDRVLDQAAVIKRLDACIDAHLEFNAVHRPAALLLELRLVVAVEIGYFDGVVRDRRRSAEPVGS
jgi:hypothetical protein